jgi:uncharacterized membrane protein YdjX (TVP38/TMEM64 family)
MGTEYNTRMTLDRQQERLRPADMAAESGTDESNRRVAADSRQPVPAKIERIHLAILGMAIIVCTLGLALYGQDLWTLVQDEQALEAFIIRLGWFGPLALVLLNMVQIIVAPIPGYVMQLAAGFLYGPVWGGIWGSIGLLGGAMLAMWLSRVFGRPLVTRLVGNERLAKWEQVTHSDSVLLWFVLILTPTGDLPYFLAGLSHVRFRTIFWLTLAIRVPTTFVVAAAGAGVMLLSPWQLLVAAAVLVTLLILFLRYQHDLIGRLDASVQRHVQKHVP